MSLGGCEGGGSPGGLRALVIVLYLGPQACPLGLQVISGGWLRCGRFGGGSGAWQGRGSLIAWLSSPGFGVQSKPGHHPLAMGFGESGVRQGPGCAP